MAGDVPHAGIGTLYYIRSENAFNRGRGLAGFEVLKSRLSRRNPYLLSLRRVAGDLSLARAICLGLQDIPVATIIGSAGRDREFTRRFLPLTTSQRQEERWRNAYVRAMTGVACPPITVCRIADADFVINGHHRVSVARYLGLETIQAHVSELQGFLASTKR